MDTTALANAIRAMREAVAQTKDESVQCAKRGKTSKTYKTAEFQEYLAARALLTALDGIPERLALLALLEEVAVAARGVWYHAGSDDRWERLRAALAALPGGTDGD